MDALPKLMKRELFKKSCGQILPNNKQQSDCYIMVALEEKKTEQLVNMQHIKSVHSTIVAQRIDFQR